MGKAIDSWEEGRVGQKQASPGVHRAPPTTMLPDRCVLLRHRTCCIKYFTANCNDAVHQHAEVLTPDLKDSSRRTLCALRMHCLGSFNIQTWTDNTRKALTQFVLEVKGQGEGKLVHCLRHRLWTRRTSEVGRNRAGGNV
ncbi:hypothetical protein ABBQ38_002598 [Trebouxia sp. C0009 RCD-2024]